MKMTKAALALCLAGAASGVVHSQGFLSIRADMRPDLVAQTLSKVEEEWRAQAAAFAECNATVATDAQADCSAAPQAFGKSCHTVVTAVVQASSGQRDVVTEYMKSVCAAPGLDGWRASSCQDLSVAIHGKMTEDAYDNRESLDVSKLCQSFFGNFAATEKVRVEKERAEHEAEEKKEAEEKAEAEKKAAAEAVTKAAEEAAAAKQKAAEEADRTAQEAKAKAEEAGARLVAKQAEAAKVAEEAKEKQDEAAAMAAEVQKAKELANKTASDVQKAHAVATNQTVVVTNTTEAAKVENKTAPAAVKVENKTAPVAVKANVTKAATANVTKK